MKRADAEGILKNENLIAFNFFENRADASDEMVIKEAQGRLYVYATNERAAKITDGERVFENEEEALDNFIKRLRALNKYLKGFNN